MVCWLMIFVIIIYSSCCVGILAVLYIALIMSESEYESVIWNNRTSTDSIKIENIGINFQIYGIVFTVLHFLLDCDLICAG
jgi:hypothetical protein